MTREEVVQAALKVERWCAEEFPKGDCRLHCPFRSNKPWSICLLFYDDPPPKEWGLEKHLRTRGLKHDD